MRPSSRTTARYPTQPKPDPKPIHPMCDAIVAPQADYSGSHPADRPIRLTCNRPVTLRRLRPNQTQTQPCNRQRASRPSHDGTPAHPNHRFQPPNPRLCEPTLAQRHLRVNQPVNLVYAIVRGATVQSHDGQIPVRQSPGAALPVHHATWQSHHRPITPATTPPTDLSARRATNQSHDRRVSVMQPHRHSATPPPRHTTLTIPARPAPCARRRTRR